MIEIKVGQILAKEGAYNRKYKVVKITQLDVKPLPGDFKQWAIELQPLGSYYQDGRVKPVKTGTPSREVIGWGSRPTLTFYVVDSSNVYKG